MIRAVNEEAALIGRPNHGTRAEGSMSAKAATSAWRAPSNQDSNSNAGIGRYRSAMVSGETWPSASMGSTSAVNPSGSVAERTATSSKNARWLI